MMKSRSRSSSSSSFCLIWLVWTALAAAAHGGIVNKVWNKFEFKYLIHAGEVECFYQPTVAGTVFHVSYRVIRGDDITATIIDPRGSVVQNEVGQQTGSYQIQQTPFDGDYSVCLNNVYSHLTSKLVYVYILTFKSEDLVTKFQEDKVLNETAHMAKEISDKINYNLIEIFTHQAMARFRQTRDEYLIEANNTLVLYWSAFQSLLIISAGFFQVYFIRRLFSVPASRR